MLWAACCICFFGFFRLGEITCATESKFDKDKDLAISDLRLDNHYMYCRRYVLIHLKQSKTDQFRKGAQVVIGTDNNFCPLAALLQFLSLHGSLSGPLFLFKNGSF